MMTNEEAKERGLPYVEPNGFLRNTKLFSQAADTKLRTGRYCPHPIKSKPWVDFWVEEKRRCLEGYQLGTVRVTGYHYFYLNYYPINVVHANANDSGEVARLFPKFWLMDWQFFRILEYCEKNGLHFGAVKARGCGYSEKGASIGARDTNIVRNITTNENITVKQFRKTFYFATLDEYLGGDGIVDKCFKAIDYLNEETDGFFKKSFHIANKPAEYKREAGFKKKDGSPVKTGGYVQGVIVDKPDKAHPYSSSIFTDKGYKKWGELTFDDKIYNEKGELKSIVEFHEFGEQDIYEIEFSDGRIVHSTLNHEWIVNRWVTRKEKRVLEKQVITTERMIDLVSQPSYVTNKIKIEKNAPIDLEYQHITIDPYVLGLLLGDGYMARSTSNRALLSMMREDLEDISKHIIYEINYSKYDNVHHSLSIPCCNEFLQELNLLDKQSHNKFIPDNYKYNSRSVRLALINGLLDTDGSVTRDYGVIEYVTVSKQLADDFIWVVRSLGYLCSVKIKIQKNKKHQDVYRCYIYCNPDCTDLFNLKRKKDRISIKKHTPKGLQKSEYFTVKSVKFSHVENARCITTEESTANSSGQYLIEDFVTTLNCRGKRGYTLLFEESGANKFLEKAINISRPLVELQGSIVGKIIIWGTSNEDDRGVEGLKKVILQPQGFRMAKFKNVWEREGQALSIDELDTIPSDPLDFIIPYGTDEYFEKDTGIGWFVPIYDTLFKDEDGNPLRVKAFEQVMRERKAILSGQSEEDAMSYFADHPLTVSEALIKSKGKEFNSPKLARQIVNVETGLVDVKPKIGRFFLKKDKEGRINGADFMEDSTGHWAVYEMPSWSLKKQNYWEVFLEDAPTRPTKIDKLYISGIDSIDQGTDDGDAKGSSLACVIKKRFPKENAMSDPFANTYVAFYKHRPKLPKDSFEEILACLIFYNATALVEYTKKTIVDYIVDQQKLGRFLAHEPSVPGEYNKNYRAKKYKKGVRATNEIIDLYVNFIKEYIDDHSERMYHLPWLKQLVNYVKIKKTVYDYVAAMGMCEILSREYREILPQDKTEKEPEMGLARWHIDPYTGKKKFGVPEPLRHVRT